jgi:hypothetical protein
VHVIGETLRRATREDAATVDRLQRRFEVPAPETHEAFIVDPLGSWIETTLGLAKEPDSGRLVRAEPRPIDGPGGAASVLADQTGASIEQCALAIRETLMRPSLGMPTPYAYLPTRQLPRCCSNSTAATETCFAKKGAGPRRTPLAESRSLTWECPRP